MSSSLAPSTEASAFRLLHKPADNGGYNRKVAWRKDGGGHGVVRGSLARQFSRLPLCSHHCQPHVQKRTTELWIGPASVNRPRKRVNSNSTPANSESLQPTTWVASLGMSDTEEQAPCCWLCRTLQPKRRSLACHQLRRWNCRTSGKRLGLRSQTTGTFAVCRLRQPTQPRPQRIQPRQPSGPLCAADTSCTSMCGVSVLGLQPESEPIRISSHLQKSLPS
jgi:hypothetical protein